MHITIREWAIQEFGFAPSASTLASYAKTKTDTPCSGQIRRKMDVR